MANELKPIRSEHEYDEALLEIERLWGSEPGTADGDRLDIILMMAEAYEARNHPVDPPDPVDAILFRMDQQGLTRKDLEPFIGSRARVTEILNRKRGLSIDMIRRLHEGLGISAEILIHPSRQDKAA